MALIVDFPVVIIASLTCFPLFLSSFVVSRMEGILFLLGYLVYTGFLILMATGRVTTDALPGIMMSIAIPGWGVIMLLIIYHQTVGRGKKRKVVLSSAGR